MNDDSQPPMPRHADDRLTEILTVERIEDNFFRGIETPNGEGRMFGGQVLGQALMAATHTVEGDRVNHSLHGYFMRAGDATKLVSGSTRAEAELGWQPQRSTLDQMIADAWRWQRTGHYER